jgi:hypothetical protein
MAVVVSMIAVHKVSADNKDQPSNADCCCMMGRRAEGCGGVHGCCAQGERR